MGGESMKRIGAMHIIDTLAAAGAERVAVNIVNALQRDQYVTYLCTTRADGPLDALVAPDVVRLRLHRTSRFDFGAVKRLRRFIQSRDIRLIHAHSSALFIARLAAWGTGATIVWHAHYGRYAVEDQAAYRYRAAMPGIGGVLTVNQEMAEWCSRRLKVPAERVWYLPNPVALEESAGPLASPLPGIKGSRIICLANFRPEKDHFTLVRAMARAAREVPGAHLILAGKTNDENYQRDVQKEIAALGIEGNVSMLGERHDVSAILRSCDIGVLSSSSEGLPMSLLEYGAAGLPAIATDVGQCGDVLDCGRAGILVPSGNPDELAAAMTQLLQSSAERSRLAALFRERVMKTYDSKTVIRQISDIYRSVLGERAGQSKQVAAEHDVVTSESVS
jgi:glycosyltransferase involved in cell wall biosynthesis